MVDTPSKPRRVLTVRRSLTLGTLAVAVTGSAVGATTVLPNSVDTPDRVLLAAAEGESGEGEGGEGRTLAPQAQLTRDLGLVEARLRAGFALQFAGDTTAAQAQLAATTAAPHAPSNSQLATDLAALADAVDTGQDTQTLRPLYDAALTTIALARGTVSPKEQMAGVVALAQLAGEEYSLAVADGAIVNLNHYQTSFGLLQVVAVQAAGFAASDDASVAKAGQKMLKAFEKGATVFGDIQGQGTFDVNPGAVFGTAARIELAAAGVK